MFYPSSAVQNCRKHLTNCLSRDNFVSCTCGILLIHIINKEGCRMKCPITGTVWGNMGNATNHIVLCYTRLNNRYKRAQTFQNLASLIICTLSHSRLLAAIRPERRVTRRETTPLSACAPDNTASTHTHVHMYVIQSYEQCGLSSSCQIAMHTCPHTHTHTHTHTSVPPLPKIPCSCFLSLGLCVFLCMPEFLFAFTFSPKQGKGKQKHNERIKGDYRLSEFWNSNCLCVCVCVWDVHVFLQRTETRECMFECVCLHVSAQGLCVSAHVSHMRNLTKPQFSTSLSWPHHRGMDTNYSFTSSFGRITQSKQHISEKHLYKISDTYLSWWAFVLTVLQNFLHGACFCEAIQPDTSRCERGQHHLPHWFV